MIPATIRKQVPSKKSNSSLSFDVFQIINVIRINVNICIYIYFLGESRIDDFSRKNYFSMSGCVDPHIFSNAMYLPMLNYSFKSTKKIAISVYHLYFSIHIDVNQSKMIYSRKNNYKWIYSHKNNLKYNIVVKTIINTMLM